MAMMLPRLSARMMIRPLTGAMIVPMAAMTYAISVMIRRGRMTSASRRGVPLSFWMATLSMMMEACCAPIREDYEKRHKKS
jgi:hypothetical protein